MQAWLAAWQLLPAALYLALPVWLQLLAWLVLADLQILLQLSGLHQHLVQQRHVQQSLSSAAQGLLGLLLVLLWLLLCLWRPLLL